MQNYQGPTVNNFGAGEKDGGAMGHALSLALGGAFAVSMEIPMLRKLAWNTIKSLPYLGKAFFKGGANLTKSVGSLGVSTGKLGIRAGAVAGGTKKGTTIASTFLGAGYIGHQARKPIDRWQNKQYDGLVQNLGNIGGNIF